MSLPQPGQLPLFTLEKTCTACLNTKSLESFDRQLLGACGRRSTCKTCRALERLRNRDVNRAYQKLWYDAHKDQVKARVRAWHWAHRDKSLRASQEYYRSHKDHLNALNRMYWLNHREQVRTMHQRYYRNNPHLFRLHRLKRRAREAQAEGFWTVADLEAILSRQQGLCAYCACKLQSDMHMDHIIPLARGGSNWPSNLTFSCPYCNRSKNAKTPEEFYAYRARIAL